MPKCARCGNAVSIIEWVGGICPKCVSEQSLDLQRMGVAAQVAVERLDRGPNAGTHIILTTETSHNLPVTERLGIITAECVVGMNVFRDIAASARDLFGGRSETMQKGLRQAREAALSELREEALTLGADAVVGVDLDYSEISGSGKSMLFLVASGTAVKLADDRKSVVCSVHDAPPLSLDDSTQNQ